MHKHSRYYSVVIVDMLYLSTFSEIRWVDSSGGSAEVPIPACIIYSTQFREEHRFPYVAFGAPFFYALSIFRILLNIFRIKSDYDCQNNLLTFIPTIFVVY